MFGVVLAQVINGLVLGFLYIVIAEGLSIIFGMIGIVNFAHGAFFALGAYFALTLRPLVGDGAIVILSPIIVGLAGMIVEATLLRPLYNKEPLLGLLLTFGLALFLQELIRTVWGARGHPFDAPQFLAGFIVLIAVWLFLEKTPWGRVIRAGSRDPEMVSMLGINLRTIFTITFGLGTALAGIAGVLAAPLWSVVPSMADLAIMPAFVVVTIGGLGSFRGTVIAGLLVGVSVALTIQFFPAASTAVMYILMAFILLVRPRGLFGERWERFE
jgi:branched-chain amino acid transport system permease protein